MLRDVGVPKPRQSRSYLLDGQRVPSVTTILAVIRKPFLEQWRGRLGNMECDRIARESADLGTRVHRICERINLNGRRDGPVADLEPYAAAYWEWFGQNVKRVLGSEVTLLSRRHRYGGTADLVAELRDGSTAVVDLKTGGVVSGEFGLQLAAYQQALSEQEDISADRRLVVQMPRKEPGVLLVHEYGDHQADWRAFLAASILWWRLFSDGR